MAKIDDINEIQHILQTLSPVDLTKALVMIGRVLDGTETDAAHMPAPTDPPAETAPIGE